MQYRLFLWGRVIRWRDLFCYFMRPVSFSSDAECPLFFFPLVCTRANPALTVACGGNHDYKAVVERIPSGGMVFYTITSIVLYPLLLSPPSPPTITVLETKDASRKFRLTVIKTHIQRILEKQYDKNNMHGSKLFKAPIIILSQNSLIITQFSSSLDKC